MAWGDVRLNLMINEQGQCRCHGLLSPVHSPNGDISRLYPRTVDGELDYSSCIQQRIAVWLATKKGERPIHPHFGCCIRDYMHTPLTIALVKEIRGKVERELKELFPETSVSMVKVEVPERNTIKVSAVVGDTSVTVTADGETLTKLNTQLRAAMRSLGMDYLR